MLWDRETGAIVSNESAEVIVMLNDAWDEHAANPGLDSVYHGHFKCNLRRVIDRPSLWGYLRDLLTDRARASAAQASRNVHSCAKSPR